MYTAHVRISLAWHGYHGTNNAIQATIMQVAGISCNSVRPIVYSPQRCHYSAALRLLIHSSLHLPDILCWLVDSPFLSHISSIPRPPCLCSSIMHLFFYLSVIIRSSENSLLLARLYVNGCALQQTSKHG